MVSIHIVSYNNSYHTINAVESILRTVWRNQFEILVIECGSDWTNQKVFQNWYANTLDPRIKYVLDKGNLGFSGGINYLASIQSSTTEYVIEMNNDMFFAPNSVDRLVEACQVDSAIGVACCTLISDLYDREKPSIENVEEFINRYSGNTYQKTHSYGGSNVPWAIPIATFNQLLKTDVWNSKPLPFNKYPGIWDESIDPYLAAWCADWDLHNRIFSIGKQLCVLETVFAYHYGSTSVSKIQTIDWQRPSVENYIMKYGPKADMRSHGMTSKGLPVIKKDIPDNYPIKSFT